MTGPAHQGTRMSPSEVDVVELRVGMSALASEVGQLRAAIAPLAALPTQLDAIATLHAERLTNHIERHKRDMTDVRRDLEAVEARCEERHDEVKDWQTWAIRLVLGAVLLAAVAALGLAG